MILVLSSKIKTENKPAKLKMIQVSPNKIKMEDGPTKLEYRPWKKTRKQTGKAENDTGIARHGKK